ncbi:ABC transporter ATP-binding protein [Catellatospora chokoriensis]|uniref:Multidrug ABC transporter permease n=2 Tax=Catellatospora chokoriensis TaxID=310353 RepID=A0A8J3K060_9ACTN|nr:multidrug ABC transporter permease [Catellatospora chokoriensis]
MSAPSDAATTTTAETTPATGSVLPQMRVMWWEHGVRARADAGLRTLAQALPRLVGTALRIAWRADRARTAIVLSCTVLAGVMSTAGLLATQQVLVGLFAAAPTPDRVAAALPALIVLAGAAALRAGMGIATGYALNGLTPRVDRAVQRQLFEATTAVRLDAFDEDAFADDMERAARGMESVIGLVNAMMALAAGAIGVLAVAVALVVVHPLLLGAMLLATVPNAWAALKAGHLEYQTYLAGSVRRRRMWILNRLMADRMTAAELRAYGLRGFLLGQYDTVMETETRIQLDLARRVTTTNALGAMAGGVATGAVYGLLGWLLLDGAIPLSAAATAVIALQAARHSLSTVTYQVDALYMEGRHFDDYTEFMERAKAHVPAADGSLPAAELETLRVEQVSLSYPDRAAPAVDGVSLVVHAGQTVAFVGENGSGKTTLAAVIAALRAPSAGTVSWNGVPLAELDADQLRARIAVVSQDYWKWPFTAEVNIRLGEAGAPVARERIEAAALRAVAHDMIMQLPFGYDTLLDRTFADGQDLSGGQWQRITAARGFLRDADLLIMDEPSSALDPRAEDALFQAIRDRQGRRTTILITHRLANVRHADVIYVLHEGRLVQSGRHDELMAAGGRYAELFTLQAHGYLAAG